MNALIFPFKVEKQGCTATYNRLNMAKLVTLI